MFALCLPERLTDSVPTNSFDILVLGHELSGLLAATLCATRGYRVGLIRGDHAPCEYRHGEFLLPVEPFSMVGFDSPAISQTWDELHLTHEIRRRINSSQIPFQLVTQNARVDVNSDDVALTRELRRELRAVNYPSNERPQKLAERARKASEIGQILDAAFTSETTIPATSFRAKRDLAKLFATMNAEATDLFVDEPPWLLQLLWSAPAAISSIAGQAKPTPLSALRTFELWRRGLPRIEGDASGLHKLLLEKFTASGGELLDAIRVSELSYSWGKVSGIKTKNGDELGATKIIAAMPIDELFVLAGRKGQKKIESTVEELEASGYRYTLNLVVDESGIPEGMAHTVLCIVDPEQPLIGANVFAIFIGEPDDRARVVVSVSAICPPPSESSHLEAAFANLRVSLRESLEMVMPFINQHILLIHSPHESLPAEGKAATKNGALGKAMASRPLWRRIAGEPDLFGSAGISYQVGLKNLILASEQVLLNLGLEGQFAVARGATTLACQGIGKRKSTRGEVLGR